MVANKAGLIVLYLALMKGADIAVQELCKGAGVKTADKIGVTALNALMAPNGALQVLLSRDNSATNNTGLTTLHLAAGKGYKEVIQELLENGANISVITKIGVIALYLAVINRNKDVVY